MLGYKSPEAVKTFKQALVFSSLLTLLLAAVVMATFVFDLIIQPAGVALMIVLMILDAAVVVPAMLKARRFEDAFTAQPEERR